MKKVALHCFCCFSYLTFPFFRVELSNNLKLREKVGKIENATAEEIKIIRGCLRRSENADNTVKEFSRIY